MKKVKILIFLLMILNLNITIVSAKNVLHSCDYYNASDSLSGVPEGSILCEIYTDYTHQCYVAEGKSSVSSSDKKVQITNWNESKITDFKAYDYFKANNKCPKYMIVVYGKASALYASITMEDNTKIMLSSELKGKKYTHADLKGGATDDDKTLATSRVKEYTENINNRINNWKLENCIDNSKSDKYKSCEDSINSFRGNINNWTTEVNGYITKETLKSSDDVIKKFQKASSNYDKFEKQIKSDLEDAKNNNKTSLKAKCSDYTYGECINRIKDTSGNECMKDEDTKTCRQKYTCESSYEIKKVCPDKSDFGHTCKLEGNECKDLGTIFTCPDYAGEDACRSHSTDDAGNKCVWSDSRGCVIKKESSFIGDSGGESGSADTDIPKLCSSTGVLKSFRFLGYLLMVTKIVIPLLLIGMGCYDYGKALISGNQDSVKKANQSFITRIILSVLIFIIPTILNFVFGLMRSYDKDQTNFANCSECLFKPNKCK